MYNKETKCKQMFVIQSCKHGNIHTIKIRDNMNTINQNIIPTNAEIGLISSLMSTCDIATTFKILYSTSAWCFQANIRHDIN